MVHAGRGFSQEKTNGNAKEKKIQINENNPCSHTNANMSAFTPSCLVWCNTTHKANKQE